MPSPWRYFLYDAHSVTGAGATAPATLIGELRQPRARRLSQGIRKMATASFTVDRDEPLVPYLALGHRTLLVIRDGRYIGSYAPPAESGRPATTGQREVGALAAGDYGTQPLFVGPIVTCQERGDDVAVTAADAFWRLTKRVIGVLPRDVNAAGGGADPFTGVRPPHRSLATTNPKSTIIRGIIQAANEIYAPVTGDGYTATAPGPGSFTGVAPPPATDVNLAGEGVGLGGPYVARNAAEAIQEIAGNLDAPEWIIEPVLPRLYDIADYDSPDASNYGFAEPLPVITPAIILGRLRLAMQIGGVLRAGARFEMGYGLRNVSDFQRITDSSGVMTYGLHLPADENGVAIARAATPGPYPVRYDDVIQADVTIDDMRKKLLDEHLTVRATPRQIITFDPTTDLAGAPVFGVDYQLGDIVPLRVVRRGNTIINAQLRVYGADRALSDDGEETTAPILVPNA